MATPASASFERWKEGYFSPVTATLDWCEANYQFSHYIAEMANTMSNLCTMGLALYAARVTRQESLPSRFIIGHLLFALVGLGSFFFHATLTYEAQMGDELPMILTVTHSLWILLDSTKGFGNLSDNMGLPLALLSFDGFFTWSYYIYRNPVYHQAVFGTLLVSAAARTTYVLRYSPLSLELPAALKKEIGHIYATGASLFVFGFFVWNLDNIFCDTISEWKVQVGWPAAFLLEGHSWWHILTALGTYWMSTGTEFVALAVKDDYRKYNIVYSKGLPFVRRIAHKRTD